MTIQVIYGDVFSAGAVSLFLITIYGLYKEELRKMRVAKYSKQYLLAKVHLLMLFVTILLNFLPVLTGRGMLWSL